MSRFSKLMLSAALCLASASVFVGCSDDDPTTMGPLPVNSCRVTGTTVTVTWSIVPNDNCKGYEVTLYQGAIGSGQELQKKDIDDNGVCSTSFSGLVQNTKYHVKTKAKPGNGFTGADEFFREFTTAPDVYMNAVKESDFQFYQVKRYVTDSTYVYDNYYRVNLTWPAIPESNCGGYTVSIYKCAKADWTTGTKAVASVAIGKVEGVIATNAEFEKLDPDATYTASISARPNSACDYAAGDICLIDFTVPTTPDDALVGNYVPEEDEEGN